MGDYHIQGTSTCFAVLTLGVQGGSVASLCGHDTKVCGFDSHAACTPCLFMEKVQKPHNVYVGIV